MNINISQIQHKKAYSRTLEKRSEPAVETSQSTQQDTVKIATYNVKNLFDNEDVGNRTRPKPTHEQEAAGRVIQNSGADVVALQEVENKEVLENFVEQYVGTDYKYIALIESNDDRGIDVAFISKHPFTNVVGHNDEKFKNKHGETLSYKRAPLRVDVNVGGYPFSLYSVHLKSHFGGQSADIRRQAEAGGLNSIVTREMGDFDSKNFLVMGDFNDRPHTETMAIARGERGGSPLTSTTPKEVITYPHRKYAGQIDHILMPEHMEDNLVGTEVVQGSDASRGSDHRMLIAEFKLTDDLAR